jgi:hypothetical protein
MSREADVREALMRLLSFSECRDQFLYPAVMSDPVTYHLTLFPFGSGPRSPAARQDDVPSLLRN